MMQQEVLKVVVLATNDILSYFMTNVLLLATTALQLLHTELYAHQAMPVPLQIWMPFQQLNVKQDILALTELLLKHRRV